MKRITEKRSTLKEISQRIGIPISTVAAVLRNDPKCFAGSKVRQKILATARELNYRPSIIARTLRTKKSNTLGLILPNLRVHVTLANMELIESLAWERGYHLFIGYSQNNPAKEEALLSDFLSRYVDGVILVVGQDSSRRSYLKQLLSERFPLVTINCLEKFKIPSVSTDFYRGGQMAARYLLGLGHRRIAIITGDTRYSTLGRRVAGFQERLQKTGLKPKITIILKENKGVIPLEKEVTEGCQSATKLLSARGRGPTAIFAGNDEIGLGVIKAALKSGLKVPEELSVIGFDDSLAAAFAPIPLTTIRQPREEVSQKAVEIILALIKQKEAREKSAEAVPILLKPELIIRSSVAPPP